MGRLQGRAGRAGMVVGVGLCGAVGLLAADVAAWGQAAVPSISTREGTRSTGRTGAPDFLPPAIANNPNAWPLPNGAQGWQTSGTPVGTVYPTVPVGKVFTAAGPLPDATPPPTYTVDRQGNVIYIDPVTGILQTFGTNIQKVK